MATYGSDEGVRTLLKSSPAQTFNANELARIQRLRAVVSSLVEAELGRTFGGSADPATAELAYAGDYPTHRLLLPRPARSIAGVYSAPAWDGSAWTGTPLDGEAWYGDLYTESGFLAVASTFGAWSGTYLVSAVWHDSELGGGVPADIDYLVDYVTARQYQIEQSSTTGERGPDGTVTFARDGWREETVKRILARYAPFASPAVIL